MRIPSNPAEKEEFLRVIIDACMASWQERSELYEKRRRYYMYGQNADQKVRFNRLKSHIKLVSSFLFSSEGLIYNVTPPKNADEHTIQQFLALQDDWNEDVHNSGLADEFADALTWAVNFDTMILKLGWNDITSQVFAEPIEPVCFGVYREDKKSFATQPAMNHSMLLDWDDACTRLARAGKSDQIKNLQIEGGSAESGLPAPLNQLIISATGGSDVTGNITGEVNPQYSASPRFRANVLAPMVRFHETWIWDDDSEDYRIFHSLAGPVLLSDSRETIQAITAGKKRGKKVKFDSETNWYLPKENPFIPITPYTMYNYFWGDCHQEDIIPLQEWSNTRITQIDEILSQQVDPLRTIHGEGGLLDEKADLNMGAYWASDNPMSKVEDHRPPMPEDLFKEFNEIGALMMEQSGLTEVVAGKNSGGARGGQQQKQMQITGGGQIRKVAIGLEKALVRMGDLGLKLKMKNDDGHIRMPDGTEFVAAQMPDDFNIRVDGHSHSPLFTMETKELAALLFKAQAIDREWLIRMTGASEKQNLLHALRSRMKAEQEARQQELAAGAHKGKKK